MSTSSDVAVTTAAADASADVAATNTVASTHDIAPPAEYSPDSVKQNGVAPADVAVVVDNTADSSSNASTAPASPVSVLKSVDASPSPSTNVSPTVTPSKTAAPAQNPTIASPKVKKATPAPSQSSSKPSPSPPPANTSVPSTTATTAAFTSASSGLTGGLNWRSMLGLGETINLQVLAEWLPDFATDVAPSIIPLPNGKLEEPPATPPLDLPQITSMLPPPPLPSSALRFGWIDEYGDYHPLPSSNAANKINPRLQKAKEVAKEMITQILQHQEKVEQTREPGSPRVSALMKNQQIDSPAAQIAITGTNSVLNAAASVALGKPAPPVATEIVDEVI